MQWMGKGKARGLCSAGSPQGCINAFFPAFVSFPGLLFCSSRGWPNAPGSDSDSRIASLQPTPPSNSKSPIRRRGPLTLRGVAARCRSRSLRPSIPSIPSPDSPRRCGAQCQVMDCRVWTEASAANTHSTAQHPPAAGTVTAVTAATRPGSSAREWPDRIGKPHDDQGERARSRPSAVYGTAISTAGKALIG